MVKERRPVIGQVDLRAGRESVVPDQHRMRERVGLRVLTRHGEIHLVKGLCVIERRSPHLLLGCLLIVGYDPVLPPL